MPSLWQEWELAERDPTGLLEYPTQFSRFQNVSKLSIFIPDTHGADTSRIYYIGLKGVGTDHKRRAVQVRGARSVRARVACCVLIDRARLSFRLCTS